jgi:hypothetical protein
MNDRQGSIIDKKPANSHLALLSRLVRLTKAQLFIEE